MANVQIDMSGGGEWLKPLVKTNKQMRDTVVKRALQRIKAKRQRKKTANAFCPTGEGGGIDNSCPPNKGATVFNPDTDSSGSLNEDLEYAIDTSPEYVKQVLDHYQCEPVGNSFFGKELNDVYISPDGDIIEWDGESTYISFTDEADAPQWVYEYDTEDAEAQYEDQFNDDFWSSGGGTLYHATDSDNVESILKTGLEAKSDTRGMSNRNVGDSVYTTAEIDEANSGSYGDAIIEIDTNAMARDGVKPYVSLEPDEVTGTVKEALAHAIGLNDFYYERESGMSPNTIVFSGSIPAKYLKRDQP